MMNGALTLDTHDSATNIFLFGLTAQQVADNRGCNDPRLHYAPPNRKPARRSV